MKMILDMKCRLIVCDEEEETYNVDRVFRTTEELKKYIDSRFVPYAKINGDPVDSDTRLLLAEAVFRGLKSIYYEAGFAMIYPVEITDSDSGYTIAPCILYVNPVDIYNVEDYIREISE